MSDDRPGREEEEQAEALARALDGESAVPGVPRDALGVAGLLRLSQAGELDEARQESVLERVMSMVPLPEGSSAPQRSPWLRWLVPAGGLAAAAALVLVLVLPAGPEATELPRPDAALLRHQAEAASGSATAARRLHAGMQRYRRDMLARLEERYARGR